MVKFGGKAFGNGGGGKKGIFPSGKNKFNIKKNISSQRIDNIINSIILIIRSVFTNLPELVRH